MSLCLCRDLVIALSLVPAYRSKSWFDLGVCMGLIFDLVSRTGYKSGVWVWIWGWVWVVWCLLSGSGCESQSVSGTGCESTSGVWGMLLGLYLGEGLVSRSVSGYGSWSESGDGYESRSGVCVLALYLGLELGSGFYVWCLLSGSWSESRPGVCCLGLSWSGSGCGS